MEETKIPDLERGEGRGFDELEKPKTTRNRGLSGTVPRAEGPSCHAYGPDADTVAWYTTTPNLLAIFVNAE